MRLLVTGRAASLLVLLLCFAAVPAGAGHADTVALNASVAAQWDEALRGDLGYLSRHAHARWELQRFNESCAWISPSWARVRELHASLDRILVMDVRCARWPGLGDSLQFWSRLLRVGRALGRATFLWVDHCSNESGVSTPRRSTPLSPANCSADPGALFTGLGGVDWRWGAHARRAVARRHAGDATELALAYECNRAKATGPGCPDAELRFSANGTLAWRLDGVNDTSDALMDFLASGAGVASHPWLRLELCAVPDFEYESELHATCRAAGVLAKDHKPEWRGCGSERCEMFLNTRPRARLWRTLLQPLSQMERFAAVVAVPVRTGVADHASRLPDLEARAEAAAAALATPDVLAARIEALMVPCPPEAPRVTRTLVTGTPCVSWHHTLVAPEIVPNVTAARRCGMPPPKEDEPPLDEAALPPLLFPDMARRGPLGAFLECAAQNAARMAAAKPTSGLPNASYGVLLTSDSPAFKCALESSPLGRAGHAIVLHSPLGHTQYAADTLPTPAFRKLLLAAAAEFYLLGLANATLPLFSSSFYGTAMARGFGASDVAVVAMPVGFEMWFRAGRERAAADADVDAALLATLAGTLPGDACPHALGRSPQPSNATDHDTAA